jgi:uncharacterized Zn-binding protein involved in type VI secretion
MGTFKLNKKSTSERGNTSLGGRSVNYSGKPAKRLGAPVEKTTKPQKPLGTMSSKPVGKANGKLPVQNSRKGF